MPDRSIDRMWPPPIRHAWAGLGALLAIALAAGGAEAQQRRVYFALQGGKGEGWTAAGAQVEVALGERWRVAPDVLIGEGAGGGNVSAFWGLSRSEPQRTRAYAGAGIGAISADDVEELALHVRVGGELPITSRRFGVRLEVREYLIDGEGKFLLLGMIRLP